MSKDAQVAEQELKLQYTFDKNVDIDGRVIRVVGEIDEDKFAMMDAALSVLEKVNKKQITIRICSSGGEVYAALAMVGRIKRAKGIAVITEGYGKIMSAATLLLACGDKRRASEFSWAMWHETAHSFSEDSVLRTSQLKADLRQEEREHERWCHHMAEFSDRSKDFWLKKGVGHDAYFTPEELLDLGLIDEIM